MTDEDKSWFREQMLQMEARLEAKIERTRIEASENLERVETTLLTEFHKWASPLDARLRTHTALFRAIDLEAEAMDERITKLEELNK